MPEMMPVFHVRQKGERNKVLEKVVAADATVALAEAKALVGDVAGLFVTGPHEYVASEPKASDHDKD